jgi:3-isopropylmalate/(R)-2-methylmalate dehydratase large subunit
VRQGIVHVIGPELGFRCPLGALAFGIGASSRACAGDADALQKKSRTMKVEVSGALPFGTAAKDVALAIIGRLGAAGANGHMIEYCGDTIRGLDMAGRMTVSNMSVEAGARAGLIAPDQVTFDYVRGRHYAPKGAALEQAIAWWRTLPSDPGAIYDRAVALDANAIAPMVTWGTNPEAVVPITGTVPDPEDAPDEQTRAQRPRMVDYMGLTPGQKMTDLAIDVVFIGSCTNGRIEDLRAAARSPAAAVAPGVRARRAGLRPRQAPGRAGGARSHPARIRLRMARARLLHVPGHEPRPAHPRAALRQHVEPQFRRPPGLQGPHPSGLARHGRRGGDCGAFRGRARVELR